MRWAVADTEQSIPERFEQQARIHPGKQAIAGSSWNPSFADLDAAASRIARTIVDRHGAGSGRVALLLPHDAPLLAAALGALKAGKTVVALNPTDPPARRDQIISDVSPQAVVTGESYPELAGATRLAEEEAPVAIDPDSPAFLIYTSGSTGRPKGVIQTHRNMLHNVLRHTNGLDVTSDDRMALLASISGGQGVGTAWTALLNGATLCPFPTMERGTTGLARWLAEQCVTVLPASASVFRHFVRTLDRERFPDVRLVRLASEPAYRPDLEAFRRHFADHALLANTFSSTEAGNISRHLVGPDDDVPDGRLPVGRPADGIEVLLRDRDGREVPAGEIGEIVVRGEYLSPGYWGDEESTGERFGADTGDPRKRLFRTGDLGRMSGDGLLTLLGRLDHQVKVNGYRVELSEVELALVRRPSVAAAAVAADATARGAVKLTGYVAPASGHRPDAAALRAHLRTVLPNHAVPSSFVFLDSLPLTAQGKVDRAELARIVPPPQPTASPGEAMDETEEQLAALWADALDLDAVGRSDGFLDLGGDSLSAAVVAAELEALFGVDLGLERFAANPTVTTMAKLVAQLHAAGRKGTARPPLLPAERSGGHPMSFSQERVWRSSQTPAGRLGHTMAVPVRFRGSLDVAALRRAINRIARRHEILRTTFIEAGGRPVQVVHPPTTVDLPLVDLSDAPNPEARARALLAQEARTPFDLAYGPLLRLRLVKIRDDEHWLLRVNHHVISDGWSWRVYFDELRALYEADLQGEPVPLAEELPLQYSDFAAWQRTHLRPGEPLHRSELAWWRRVFEPPHEPLAHPFAREAPPAGKVAPGVLWWGLPPEVSAALDRLGHAAGATYFMVRLAAFAAQLAVENEREDVVVGMYATNRWHTHLQALFGDFTNLVSLRLRFAGNPTFRDWLDEVRAAVVDTSAHIDVPYAELCEGLAADGVSAPEIRAVFGRTHALAPLRFGGLDVQPLPSPLQIAPTGFTFLVDRAYEADRCAVYFDSASYDPKGVEDFVGRYRAFVSEVSNRPERRVRDVLGPSLEPSRWRLVRGFAGARRPRRRARAPRGHA